MLMEQHQHLPRRGAINAQVANPDPRTISETRDDVALARIVARTLLGEIERYSLGVLDEPVAEIVPDSPPYSSLYFQQLQESRSSPVQSAAAPNVQSERPSKTPRNSLILYRELLQIPRELTVRIGRVSGLLMAGGGS
jgi:hypothetical protein